MPDSSEKSEPAGAALLGVLAGGCCAAAASGGFCAWAWLPHAGTDDAATGASRIAITVDRKRLMFTPKEKYPTRSKVGQKTKLAAFPGTARGRRIAMRAAVGSPRHGVGRLRSASE